MTPGGPGASRACQALQLRLTHRRLSNTFQNTRLLCQEGGKRVGPWGLRHGRNGSDAVGEPEPPSALERERKELFVGDGERGGGVLHGA